MNLKVGDKYNKMDNALLKLDFAPGIKAQDINHNFNIVHDWITRERLRVGGWGIVEGFELSSNLKDFTITVGSGMMINHDGEEVYISEKTFAVGSPEYTLEEEIITCPDDGILELKYKPYSEEQYGYIEYIPPNDNAPSKEDLLLVDLSSDMQVPVMQVIDNKVYINQRSWSGKRIKITYKHVENRIDSIMLYKDGSYKYEKSIASTSPAHVELGDYINHFCIGIVYWQIDKSISVDFFTNHRSYRKVYVDEQNRLYLNGELYVKPKLIYFEEPKDPVKNDLWYDDKTNTLYIWKETNGDWGWVAVNDFSTQNVKEHKIWTPNTFPEDAQTFNFNEDEVNLFYVPNTNALEIIIDNAPLMSDQFEEIVVPNDKEYLSDGRGFRLKNPLDRATYVECIVHHNVRSKPLRETFQRAAIFVDENYEYYSPINTHKIFNTLASYVIGEDQLEVFVAGKRLVKDIEFVELIDENTKASDLDKNKMSKMYQIKIDLKEGQLVAYKISKHVWTYDHLDMMIHEIEAKANDALNKCSQLDLSIKTLNENIVHQINALQNNLDSLSNAFGSPDNYLKADSKLTVNNMPQEILDKIVIGQTAELYPTTEEIILTNTKTTDFIVVSYISDRFNRNLILNTEYALTQDENNVRVDLSSELIASDANVYIQVMKVGEH